MKTKLAIAYLLACALMAPVVSFAADDADLDRNKPKSFVKDSAITAKIKTKLASEHISSLGRIHVDTDANGVVWLSGDAKSKEEINRVVDIARGTEHVVSVKNHLKVKKEG